MKKRYKIIKEILLFVVVVVASSAATLAIAVNIGKRADYDVLRGSVEKKELRVISPVFGSIESFPIGEGQFVKKGDILATIKVFGAGSEKPNINSTIFDFDGDKIDVINPEDGVVAKKLFAEKTVLKPGIDFLVLYPIKGAVVKFGLPDSKDQLAKYASLVVLDNGREYLLKVAETLPVDSQINGERNYYGVFDDEEDSKNFYNNQKIEIKAVKQQSEDLQFSGIIVKFYKFFENLRK